MQNSDALRLSAPSLPKGGGAMTGLGGSLGVAGPDGAVTLSVPIPITAGRGFAPTLALVYNSQAGNGPFGMGWHINLLAIRRRTRYGVPAYGPSDEFVGPDGEILVPVITADGNVDQQARQTLLEMTFDETYAVTAYRSRLEQDFSRLEYWVGDDHDFWVIYSPDGQIHLLGKNATSRISNPLVPGQTAQWLLESSVTPLGEQLYYHYRAEDDLACEIHECKSHPIASAQRYLSAVYYGNRVANLELPGFSVAGPIQSDWLFSLVLDHGERGTGLHQPPTYQPDGTWLCRADCFSDYSYGFEVRTRRLCRQVLMFHHLDTLSSDDSPMLVSRLLLEYDEQPSVTTLVALRQMGYENDRENTLIALPPLEFAWQTFAPPTQIQWQPQDDLKNLNSQQPYQWLDLKGEGLAGVLYQDQGAWWYREPVRDDGGMDALTWSTAAPLASIPSLRKSATLTDLTGDGRLQWVVTAAGMAGYYDQTSAGDWLHFTPLQALPIEYSHPRAQLADMMGSGFTDMVMIGPRSVRLYAGTGKGWSKGQTVLQSEGITLPVPGADPRTLVAFSDMLGSGQQHLVQIQSNGVTCWPNLGQGRFGTPLTLLGFSQPVETFNPQQVFLADIDGSGTTDLIYAHADRLAVYLNLSGNGFAAPFDVELPVGVRFDRTCGLQVADIQGQGVASLLLSCPFPTPRHWVCHLSVTKPWLLTAMNNNMGAQHTLQYRSSAQFWLDEKASLYAQGEMSPTCYLPFAMHLHWRSKVIDEITGNQLASEIRYRYGVWDGQEREFRGFGYVEQWDSDLNASQGTTTEIAMPALTRSWFATGMPDVDNRMRSMFWQEDMQAFAGFLPRFTIGEGETETAYTPDEKTLFWLSRALKGRLLRSEVYGLDDSEQASVPYTVTEHRSQVRLIEMALPTPVVWASEVESRTYTYERIPEDPQCHQHIVLCSDCYGYPLRQVEVNYPRRAKLAISPYPYTLPETLFDSSYDDQQQHLYLTLNQQSWHHLVTSSTLPRVLGLPDGSRRDVFTSLVEHMPALGLKLEDLLSTDSLISEAVPRTFMGQQQVWYQDVQGQPTRSQPTKQALVAFTEVAMLDEEITGALADHVTEPLLLQAGYQRAPYLFAHGDEKTLWVARQGHTEYATASHFWRPLSFRETLLTGKNTVIWDRHDCVVSSYQDAAGLTTHAVYDPRFLIPIQVTDANDNVSCITLDGLGRVTSRRFWGTEQGQSAGYGQENIILPIDVDNALQLVAPLPVADILVYVSDSWMPELSSDQLQQLGLTVSDAQAARILTEDGRLRALWSTRLSASAMASTLRLLISENPRLPPHVLTLMTDRYDTDPAQQIRQQVSFSDGFGRLLQTASRHVPGEACLRCEDGSLAIDENGKPLSAFTTYRWAVSGRVEYDNKGQSVRHYQPYFLDDWRYVSDDNARQELWADTHQYDPVGREYQVVTAKGFLRRTYLTPWFTVLEDENDTAL